MKKLYEAYKRLDTYNVATFLVLIIAYLLSFLFSALGYTPAHYYTFIAHLFEAIIIVLAFYAINTFIINRLKDEQIENVIERYQTEFAKKEDWFYSMKRLQDFEKYNEGFNEVWVVSNNLQYDIDDDLFKEIVRKNLNKNITYKYIYPDEKRSLEAAAVIIAEYEDCIVKPLMHPIKQDFFDYPCDIIIFNPNHKKGQKLNIFMELKINKDVANRAWVRIDNSLAGVIKSSIQKDIKEYDAELINAEIKEIKKILKQDRDKS